MPKCIVSGCSNHTANKEKNLLNGIMLHTFPKNLLRIKCWLSQICQDFEDIESFAKKILEGKKTDNFRICSEHFSPDSYRRTKRKKVLKDNAIPRHFHKNPQSCNTAASGSATNPFFGVRHAHVQGSPQQFSPFPRMNSMDNGSIYLTDRILGLTLEILFLLTGEDYTVAKKTSADRMTTSSSPTEAGGRSVATETDPITTADFVSHEKNKEILQLTNQIIHLLTGEVPARCEDVAVYFSIEEWDYVDKHKHLYKNVIMDDHQQNLYKNVILDDHQQNLYKNIIMNDQQQNLYKNVLDDHQQNLSKNVILDDHQQNRYKNVILDDHRQNLSKNVMMDDHQQNLYKNVLLDDHQQNLYKNVILDDHQQNLYKNVILDDHQQNLSKNVILDDHQQNLYKNVILDDHQQNRYKNVILDDHQQNRYKNVILDDHQQNRYKNVILDDHQQNRYKNIILDDHQLSSQTAEQPVGTPCDLTKKESMFADSMDHEDLTSTAQEPLSSSECGDERVSSPEHEIEIEIEDDLIEDSLNDVGASTENSLPGGDYFSSDLSNPEPDSMDHSDAAQMPLSCSECGKCFKFRSRLVAHKRVHTGEKLFSCPECGKRFMWKSLLIQHKKIHTGEHQCLVCGRCFTNESKLIDHQRTHTGERPFTCHQCGKSFGLKTWLTVHKRLHTEENAPC